MYSLTNEPNAIYPNYPICKICDRGAMTQKKVWRMSTPVVVIGFLLLIPSVLVMIFCAAAVLMSVAGIGAGAFSDSGNATAGSAFVGWFFFFVGIGAFISGIFGWLLVMKKSVLQCQQCGATITAS
jgi:hypothetical protein